MVALNAAATAYDRHIAPKYAAIAQLVAARFPIRPHGVVLEQAIGTGALTDLLVPRLSRWSYIAIDASTSMLQVARGRVDPRIALVHADVRAIPLSSASVDVVVSSLGPVQDLPDALAEARRVLVPGGSLLFSMWGDDYEELRLLQGVRESFGGGQFPSAPFAAARERMTEAGFTDIDVTVHRLPVRHESVAAYVDYRAGFGCPPWLDPARFDDLLDAIGAAARPFTEADGAVALDWEIGVVTATSPAALSLPVPRLGT